VIKIAIFYNLKPGGGTNMVKNIVREISKRNILIDLYSHQNNSIKETNSTYIFPIKKIKNSIQQIYQALTEIKKVQKNIAKNIININYDAIFVFPCYIMQSPHILRYLPKNKTYYFFLEPKREFYERTSFDYMSLKRILSRIIRFPIKYLDQINCKSIDKIITISKFSQYNLKKIYNKESIVVYPGAKQISPKKIIKANNHNFLSLGLISMLKGHHLSQKICPQVRIYGAFSNENTKNIISEKHIIQTKVLDKEIKNIYKKHTFFLANQINEPFGLTTLEATNNNCYILGNNLGGTSEIISNNINGQLIPVKNFNLSKKILKLYDKKNTIYFRKNYIIDWSYTTNIILKIINHE